MPQYTVRVLSLFACLCLCWHVHPLTGLLAPDWRDEWLVAWCGELGQKSWLWPIGALAEAPPLGSRSQLSLSVIGQIISQLQRGRCGYIQWLLVLARPSPSLLFFQEHAWYGWAEEFSITDEASIDDDYGVNQYPFRGAVWSISIKISMLSSVRKLSCKCLFPQEIFSQNSLSYTYDNQVSNAKFINSLERTD